MTEWNKTEKLACSSLETPQEKSFSLQTHSTFCGGCVYSLNNETLQTYNLRWITFLFVLLRFMCGFSFSQAFLNQRLFESVPDRGFGNSVQCPAGMIQIFGVFGNSCMCSEFWWVAEQANFPCLNMSILPVHPSPVRSSLCTCLCAEPLNTHSTI